MKRKEGRSGKQLNKVGQVLDQQELDDFLAGKPDDTEIPLIAFSRQMTASEDGTAIQPEGMETGVETGVRMVPDEGSWISYADEQAPEAGAFMAEGEVLSVTDVAEEADSHVSGMAMEEVDLPETHLSMDEQLRQEEEELLCNLEPYETMLPVAESPKRKKKKKKMRYRVRRVAVAASLLLACFGLGGTYAWFKYITNRSVYTEEREVMVPYYLYLLNSQSTDEFSLQVMNMHPDETKQVVFCVSNEPVKESLKYSVGRESDFEYELELAYTDNIPLSYEIYALQKQDTTEVNDDTIVTVYDKTEPDDSGSGTHVVKEKEYWVKKKAEGAAEAACLKPKTDSGQREEFNREMYGENYQATGIVNVGNYDFYAEGLESGSSLRLKTTLTQNQSYYEHHYYLVEIKWKKTEESFSFSDYLKETDLAYVIVKAKQPKPEIKQQPGTTP